GTFEQRASEECEIVVVDDIGPLTAINDAAYGYDGDFDRTLRRYSGPAIVYEAHVAGRPAAALMAFDRDGDCGIFFVATPPDARRFCSSRRSWDERVGRVGRRGACTVSARASRSRRRSSASSRLRAWLRESCATALTRAPARAISRSFCSTVNALEAGTSNTA